MAAFEPLFAVSSFRRGVRLGGLRPLTTTEHVQRLRTIADYVFTKIPGFELQVLLRRKRIAEQIQITKRLLLIGRKPLHESRIVELRRSRIRRQIA